MSRPALLADENIPRPMVSALRDAGWDVRSVAESSPGMSDDDVLALVRAEQRVLLTEDKDFGELVFRLKRDISGVVLVRLPEAPWDVRLPRILAALERRAGTLIGTYTVIEPQRIRSRRIPVN